MKISNLDI